MLERRLENAGKCVRLARKTRFSAAHLYALPALDPKENRRVFGRCYGEFGHGHDYELEAFYLGRIQASSGIVRNLMDVDEVLRAAVEPLEHRHLNYEVPFFKTAVPTTENIARFLFAALAARPVEGMELERARVRETEDLFADCFDLGAGPISRDVARGEREAAAGARHSWTFETVISARHRLANPALTDAENERAFGICFRPHGHDYRVQATFFGDFDERTGLFGDRERLTNAVETALTRPFSGRDLNKTYLNTSCESLACDWFERVARAAAEDGARGRLARLSIQETRKNWFARTAGMEFADRSPDHS